MLVGVLRMWCFPKKECAFCQVTKDNPNFDVVFENGNYMIFGDRRPAAAEHYLVITKEHIPSICSLDRSRVDVVKGLKETGELYFVRQDIPREKWKFGFHIPPFSSVPHIHLHCFVLPFKNRLREAKYREARGRSGHTKGWSWFVEVDQAITILETGHRVHLAPC